MVCVAVKDIQRDFVLHGFSQPIPLPTECVTYAYNRTLQNVDVEFLGYDIPIEEAVKMHIPFTKEQDWCSVLSGKTCSFRYYWEDFQHDLSLFRECFVAYLAICM